MKITCYRFARLEELIPVAEIKAAAIRSTKLMPITGNDACRTIHTPLESGKTGSMGSSHCLGERGQKVGQDLEDWFKAEGAAHHKSL